MSEAAVGYRRIESFLERVGDVEVGEWTPGFEAAMDEDIAVPKALAEIHNAVREGNAALDKGDREAAEKLAS
ncbi:hypothetical protein NL524_31990, partial [Klebsiella pneumoniae]|nr:hypothetical protein [Klebsiella pneumoniae]